MFKFSLYVLGAYAIYYIVIIGYDYMRAPKSNKESNTLSFSVEGADEEKPKIVDASDYALSKEASDAVKKN